MRLRTREDARRLSLGASNIRAAPYAARMFDHAGVEQVVIARAPLRISLGGGGSDLPSHFMQHGGFAVSATIDRHVHMLVSRAPQDRYRLKHLEQEEVADPAAIEHPILRVALTSDWDGGPIDLASTGDVPPGTGLGSSGAYAVCTLKALAVAAGRERTPAELAERACAIEIDDLGRTVGKQDQYAAAHGGVNTFTFAPDGGVDVRRLDVSAETLAGIRERFLLFDTGQRRSAAAILAGQVERSGESGLVANLAQAMELGARERRGARGRRPRRARRPDERAVGAQARALARRLDRTCRRAAARRRSAAGANGAILMGAGGGGFILCHSDRPGAARAALEPDALELDFGVDLDGAAGWLAGD